MKNRFFSIQHKLVVLFMIITLILIISIGCTIVFISRLNSAAKFSATAKEELIHIGDAITLFFDNTKSTLNVLAEHPSVRNADETLHRYWTDTANIKASDTVKSENEKTLVALFKHFFSHFEEYVEVYLGTKWGGYATSFDGEMSAGYDPRKRSWYILATEAQGKPILTKAYMSTVGDVVICLSRSVYSPEKDFIGNMSIELTLNTLTDIIAKSTIGQTGYIMLVQDDGVILADPHHREFNFKKLNETGIADMEKIQINTDGLMKVFMDNEYWFTQVYTIKGLNWKLVAFKPESNVYAEYKKMLHLIIIIGAILSCLVFISSWLSVMRITKAIKLVAIALLDISTGDGNLRVRLPLSGNDEITQLSDCFNKTIAKIGNTISSISNNTVMLNSIGDALADSMEQTTLSIDKIKAEMNSVKGQIKEHNLSIDSTSSAMNPMISTIKSLDIQISEQSANVTAASSAVEQMVANIKTVNTILTKNKDLLIKLLCFLSSK